MLSNAVLFSATHRRELAISTHVSHPLLSLPPTSRPIPLGFHRAPCIVQQIPTGRLIDTWQYARSRATLSFRPTLSFPASASLFPLCLHYHPARKTVLMNLLPFEMTNQDGGCSNKDSQVPSKHASGRPLPGLPEPAGGGRPTPRHVPEALSPRTRSQGTAS